MKLRHKQQEDHASTQVKIKIFQIQIIDQINSSSFVIQFKRDKIKFFFLSKKFKKKSK